MSVCRATKESFGMEGPGGDRRGGPSIGRWADPLEGIVGNGRMRDGFPWKGKVRARGEGGFGGHAALVGAARPLQGSNLGGTGELTELVLQPAIEGTRTCTTSAWLLPINDLSIWNIARRWYSRPLSLPLAH
jgi:hypothetical protein